MRHQPLPPTFHAANRRRLAEAIGPDAVAIIDTADVLRRPGDFEYPFRPDSNFYYLTGIHEPEAVLLLAPDHPNGRLREVLFLSETSDFIALWAGQRLTQKQGSELSGIKTVMWLSELDQVLGRVLPDFQTVYLNNQPAYEHNPLSPSGRRAAALRARLPTHTLHSASTILGDLRTIKAPEEVAQIRRAIDITALGLRKAWAALKPGSPEYGLEAELTAEFTRQAATGPAFQAIIAAGKNATVIHYATGETKLAPDDLVLFDVGAEAGYYAADISRVVPVSGRFTTRQRAVYEAVYRAQQVGIALHKPGATIHGIDDAMREVLLEEIVKLGLITRAQAASKDSQQHLHEYYPHMSHHLGLDVHDSGSARSQMAEGQFVPGMVVTCEPGLYLQKEGIGIRLEDDILITETGHEVLSGAIPSAPDEIEAAVRGAKS